MQWCDKQTDLEEIDIGVTLQEVVPKKSTGYTNNRDLVDDVWGNSLCLGDDDNI